MSFVFEHVPVQLPPRFVTPRKWLAHKLVRLAAWLWPHPPEVAAFYVSVISEYAMKGSAVIKTEWPNPEADA